MPSELYCLGYDFGTESGRALLVNVRTGEEVATSVLPYEHGVIEDVLPGADTELGHGWALQNPGDYLEVLREVTPAVLKKAGARAEEVIGIGIDFTACTVLPTDAIGEPLCLKPEFKAEPNAWVKLWKHHGAQPQTELINELVSERGETFLERYGGKISSEWLFPKALQILQESPEVYAAAERIIEAGDWLVWKLTGEEKSSACQAGYKACWSSRDGYPSADFLGALDERFGDVVETHLSEDIHAPGTLAGILTPTMAHEIGLVPGIPVAVSIIDAHAAVPACTGSTNQLVMILGTSFCHLLLEEEETLVPGCCVVENGILPGYFGYEGGQAAGGDIFAWFLENALPRKYHDEAASAGASIHDLLERKAAALKPGETGLLALDWWNGNRSVLVDADLSGLILGYTMNTKPEQIYRALLEATAFGTRKIIRTMETSGLSIESCIACGGLPDKNLLLMQIFADVTGREFRICASEQASALGAAMLGSLAAGSQNGGFDSLADASKVISRLKEETISPVAAHTKIYAGLFAEYERLHDYFGRGENPVMKTLRKGRSAEAS
ncbi:MAG: ribulokinase [Planctomycetota bacterium]|nr:ribulokinase [Planctomycetota bacterium]